jgi:hypothetical protein
VLEDELAVAAPVEGAGVVPLEAEFGEVDEAAAGAGAALLPSCVEAWAWVGDAADMARARLVNCLARLLVVAKSVVNFFRLRKSRVGLYVCCCGHLTSTSKANKP